jgi:hypothetical protein
LGYIERELEDFARLLDTNRVDAKLVPGHGQPTKVVPGSIHSLKGRIKHCFPSEEDEVREKEERTVRLVAELQQVSGEKRNTYKRQVEAELVKARRKRLMEDAFPDHYTLYDVLCNR